MTSISNSPSSRRTFAGYSISSMIPGSKNVDRYAVAEALGQRRHGFASERGEAGRVPRLEQVGLRRPLHERVAPVEQDRREHEPDTLPAP